MDSSTTIRSFFFGAFLLFAQFSIAEELYVLAVVDFIESDDAPINASGLAPEFGGNGWNRVENLVADAYQQNSNFESLSATGVEISTVQMQAENVVLSSRVDGPPVTTLSYESATGGNAAVTFLHQAEVIARGEIEAFEVIYAYNSGENLSQGTIRLISGSESPTNPASGFFDEVMTKNNGLIEFVSQPVTGQRNGTQGIPVIGGLAVTTDLLLSIPTPAQAPFTALLPTSRTGVVGQPLSVFLSVINPNTLQPGALFAPNIERCTVALADPSLPMTVAFQPTASSTNTPSGAPDFPFFVFSEATQTLVVSLTPTGPLTNANVELEVGCANASPAFAIEGVNTLQISVSTTPRADVIAIGATPSGDGILRIAGSGESAAFGVATANVGLMENVQVTAATGSQELPVALFVCQTDPSTGECLAPASTAIDTSFAPDETSTFSVFASSSGTIDFDPGSNRIVLRFVGEDDTILGATSVALTTELPVPGS